MEKAELADFSREARWLAGCLSPQLQAAPGGLGPETEVQEAPHSCSPLCLVPSRWEAWRRSSQAWPTTSRS